MATCLPVLPTRKAYGHSQILPQPPQWKLGSAGLSLGIGPITECRSSLSRGRESWTFLRGDQFPGESAECGRLPEQREKTVGKERIHWSKRSSPPPSFRACSTAVVS